MNIETVRTELVESEESKQCNSDVGKMVDCLNKMFCNDMMPYYAENLGCGSFEIQRTIKNVDFNFSFKLLEETK